MSLRIQCDHVDPDFSRCECALEGLAFNTKPVNWTIVEFGNGDHRDYCPEHVPTITVLPVQKREQASGA